LTKRAGLDPVAGPITESRWLYRTAVAARGAGKFLRRSWRARSRCAKRGPVASTPASSFAEAMSAPTGPTRRHPRGDLPSATWLISSHRKTPNAGGIAPGSLKFDAY